MSREPTAFSARVPNSVRGGSPSYSASQTKGDKDDGETTSEGDGSDRRKEKGFHLGGEIEKGKTNPV